VALVRTDVPEELSASFIRVTRIVELGTMLAVTSNRRILPHGVTSQKIPFFIVTAVKTSNLRNLKGSDDSIQHPELLGFWILSIIQNSRS
jgi:hypothetical protein